MARKKNYPAGYCIGIIDIRIDKGKAQHHFHDIDQRHQQGSFKTDGLLVNIIEKNFAEHEVNGIDC